MTTKTCTKCGETKTVDQFYKDRSTRSGLRARCKACTAARDRAYREENRDKIADYQRAYYEENWGKITTQKRAYYEANRDKINDRKRVHYEENWDKVRARQRAYSETRREELAARNRARYALVGTPSRDHAREVTARYATRTGEPWTPEEDRYLLTDPGTHMDKALQLSRTHDAVCHRRATLRRQDNAA